jgi:hypothetical protein
MISRPNLDRSGVFMGREMAIRDIIISLMELSTTHSTSQSLNYTLSNMTLKNSIKSNFLLMDRDSILELQNCN